MATRTIFTCDRCGKEQETDNQMWQVWASFRSFEPYRAGEKPSRYPSSADKTVLWCRSCMADLGFLSRMEDDSKPVLIPEPTLEDRIREIMTEVAEDVLRNQQ